MQPTKFSHKGLVIKRKGDKWVVPHLGGHKYRWLWLAVRAVNQGRGVSMR